MKAFTVSSVLSLALLAATEMNMAQSSTMSRAVLGGVTLDYEMWGPAAGEQVVLVHAGILADWFKPLRDEPALTGRYRVLSYHRVGYAGSSRKCPKPGDSAKGIATSRIFSPICSMSAPPDVSRRSTRS